MVKASREPYILGISDSVHDRSVCLFRGAAPIIAIEEERITGQKHALDYRGLDPRNVDLFEELRLEAGCAEEHEARLSEIIDYCLSSVEAHRSDVELWIANSLHAAFPFADRAIFVNHHRAHAASAFYPSGYDDAAILVAAGHGERRS